MIAPPRVRPETHLRHILTVVLVGFGLASSAQAQIRIGQTAAFSGAVAANMQEITDGARLYIDHVNAAGGVNGQRIELISVDDKFDAKTAAANARNLIVEQNVIALFLNRGTPQTEAILPVLQQHKVPLIAPSTGAMLLHQPVNPYVFNVRATYQREAEKAVTHLHTIGITRIGIVMYDDSFGTDGAAGAGKGFDKAKAKPVFMVKVDRAKPDFAEAVEKVLATDPQAILFIAAGQGVVDGVKAVRAAGSKAQIVSLSNNASTGFIKLLGDQARGTVVAQVFPSERSALPMVQQLIELAAAKSVSAISPAMLEGYAAAKVLVEGLRRAGPAPTSMRLIKALESMERFDLGGVEISYSATDHTGLDYADLSIIDADGKFKR